MSREKKVQIVEELQEVFSKCSVGIFTDYRGLSASEMTMLRRKLGESGSGYRVVKNTLARLAAKRAGREDLVSFFEGPIAIAFGYGDITEPPRTLANYIRSAKPSLSIRGGFLSNRLLTLDDVMTLPTLPSRQELVAKLVGEIQIPISTLLTCLNTPIRRVLGVLRARIQQLEGG